MALLKLRAEKTEYVTKAEFDALSRRLEASNEITKLLFAAIEVASRSPPGFPDASPRRRLEKLAAALVADGDLDATRRAELIALFKSLDRLDKTERRREMAETIRRTSPEGLIERLQRPPRM